MDSILKKPIFEFKKKYFSLFIKNFSTQFRLNWLYQWWITTYTSKIHRTFFNEKLYQISLKRNSFKEFYMYSKFYLLTAYSLWLTAYVTHTGKQVYTTVVLQLYKLPNQVVLRHHFLFDKNYFYLFTTSMLKRFFNWTVYLKIN